MSTGCAIPPHNRVRCSRWNRINILSKLPVRGNAFTGAVNYGTADYKRVSGDANYNLTDTVGVRLNGVWHDQNVAGRDALWQSRWGFAPSLTIGLGTPTRLTASYYHLESHELPDSGLPYLYTIGNAPLGDTLTQPALGRVTTIAGVSGTVDRSAFYGLRSRDFRDTKVQQAMLRVEHDFGAVTLRNTARWSHNSQAYIFTQPDDRQGNVFGTSAAGAATAGGLVWRRANTRHGYADSIVNQTDLFGRFRTGRLEHSFSVGTEISWEKARRGTFVTRGYLGTGTTEILAAGVTNTPRCSAAAVARFYCASLFAPNPGDAWINFASDNSATRAPIVPSLPIEDTRNDGQTISLYGFDSITLTPQLILNLGARFDRFTSRITPGQPYGATTSFTLQRSDNLFNGQAGLVYKPVRDVSVYASYATAATPPNSLLGEGREDNALPTTNTAASLVLLESLKVQTTRSYEVGAKASLFHGQLALGAALFQTEITNARVTADSGSVAFIGKTRQTARHSFTAWTTISPVKSLSIGGGAFYSSRVFANYEDNRSASQTAAGVITVTPASKTLARSVPAYWRFDARIGYTLDPHWEVSVNLQNLTNKAYFNQVFTNHYATIAPGRSAFATLSVRY